MYTLFMIGHYIFVGILLSVGFLLCIQSIIPGRAIRNRKKNYQFCTILSVVILFFSMLIIMQGKRQFSADDKMTKMIAFYDSRSWILEEQIRKGTIFDRSGLPGRALAVTERINSGSFVRSYPLGESAGHLVGYSNRSRGRTGLEAVFFNTLFGIQVGYVENLHKYFTNRFTAVEPEGHDVFLTIDSRLQTASYAALKGAKGAVVVLDPNNGEVLAMASAPGFSPADADSEELWNSLVRRKDDAPLFNRARQGLYPPGSVLKMVIAAAAVEKNISPEFVSGADGFTPQFAVNPIREHEFASYKARGKVWTGHGKLSLEKAFQKSSNVYFAQLGVTLGAQVIMETMRMFVFNNNITWNTSSNALQKNFAISASVFPNTQVLTPEELSWSALGQYKVLVTPMHIALITAAIANGGILYKPSLELGRFPKVEKRIMSRKTAEKLSEMMRNVVENGTGYRANIQGLTIAGKTGTAETGVDKPHSWFASFAPLHDPELAVVVIIENGGYGGIAAAEAAQKIYLKAKKLGYFDK